MTSSDQIQYSLKGFNNEKYISIQKRKILERIDKFREGKLYLEIGGKFLEDPHAARVLPGFEIDCKKNIFADLKNISEVLFCVNAKDIKSNRQLKSVEENYQDSAVKMATEIGIAMGVKPKIVINLVDNQNRDEVENFTARTRADGFDVYKRYVIEGYTENPDKVLSAEGYGKDEYIPTSKKLIIVLGAASNSGKMSTCLGQIYLDHLAGQESGYAKFETFPIWSLPIDHPVNLAYEAATADIGDYNMIDQYHMDAYGQRAVNYNRDLEAFEIVKTLGEKFIPQDNFVSTYKSPTDMGINFAGSAIENDEVVCIASLEEIRRRANWYQVIVDRGDGDIEWVNKCQKLERHAIKYIDERGYNKELPLY